MQKYKKNSQEYTKYAMLKILNFSLPAIHWIIALILLLGDTN